MSSFEITEGYDTDLKEIGLKEFLQKPFHMQQLVAMLKSISDKNLSRILPK